MTSDGRNTSSRDTALTGWRSRLAAVVSGALVVQAATGLWMYVGSFSAAAQVQVLLHVSVGLLLIVPFAIYQWDHFVKWFRQRATAEMLVGYALGVATIVCIVSYATQGVLEDHEGSVNGTESLVELNKYTRQTMFFCKCW